MNKKQRIKSIVTASIVLLMVTAGVLYTVTTNGSATWHVITRVISSGQQVAAATVDTPNYRITVPLPLKFSKQEGDANFYNNLLYIKGKPAGCLQMVNYYPEAGDIFYSIIGNHAGISSQEKLSGYNYPAYKITVIRTQPAASRDNTAVTEQHIILMPENYRQYNANCAFDLFVYSDLPTGLLESMAKSLVIKDFTGGLTNIVDIPGGKRIVLLGKEKGGVLADLSLQVSGNKHSFNWENVINPLFTPQLLLNDINHDGKKELIIILTKSISSGANATETHIVNPKTLREIYLDNSTIVKAVIMNSTVEITIGKQKTILGRYNPDLVLQ